MLTRERRNEPYLPGVPLPEPLRITSDLAAVVETDPILVVVPSHGYRQVLREIVRRFAPGEPRTLGSATKGIEVETRCRMSEVTAQEAERAGVAVRFAVLSGQLRRDWRRILGAGGESGEDCPSSTPLATPPTVLPSRVAGVESPGPRRT